MLDNFTLPQLGDMKDPSVRYSEAGHTDKSVPEVNYRRQRYRALPTPVDWQNSQCVVPAEMTKSEIREDTRNRRRSTGDDALSDSSGFDNAESVSEWLDQTEEIEHHPGTNIEPPGTYGIFFFK